MKKLEDIPKKQIFEVPDGYFEKLPGIIQSRVANAPTETWRPVIRYSLQFGLPAVIILCIAGIFWFTQPQENMNAENMLASIQTEDLVSYLNEADITTDELLDHVELDAEDASTIEESVYQFPLTDTELEQLFNDIDQQSEK